MASATRAVSSGVAVECSHSRVTTCTTTCVEVCHFLLLLIMQCYCVSECGDSAAQRTCFDYAAGISMFVDEWRKLIDKWHWLRHLSQSFTFIRRNSKRVLYIPSLHCMRLPEWPVQINSGRVVRCPVFDRTVRFFGDLSGQKYDAKPDN